MTKRLVVCMAGERAVIAGVDGSPARIDRLASLGLVPGVELRVQQMRPVVVVETDETVIALEREIASDVLVVATEDAPTGPTF